MTMLREIGYPPLLMLLAGAIIMGIATWIIGPTYRLIISIACGLGGFAWRFPTLTDPTVLHPSMLLPFLQLAWFALTFVLIAKTLNWPRRRNRL